MSPLLTLYVTFLATFVEPDNSNGVDASILFARAMIMTAALFYILTIFNEACWLINTLVFTICMAFSLIRASGELTGTGADEALDIHWIALIGLFQVLTYASIGYTTEKLGK